MYSKSSCALILLWGLLAGTSALVTRSASFRDLRNPACLAMSASASASASSPSQTRAVVVGGGPAGALMAIYLGRKSNYKVDVFEALEEGSIASPNIRSWNVVLFDRAGAALEGAGVDLKKEAGHLALRLTGSYRHHSKKKSKFFWGSTSIGRGDLAKTLLSKASDSPNVNVHYGASFTALDMDKRTATFERDGKNEEYGYDLLVGADGVNSRVRSSLEAQVPDFSVLRKKDTMDFKTMVLPIMSLEGAQEEWKTVFHTTNSNIGCILAPPRCDGMMTAVVILPREGRHSFDALMKTSQDVRDFFGKYYPNHFGPDGPNEELASEFLQRRRQNLNTLYCSGLAHDNVVLIGDAAHAMTASLGQGVNSALEDCKVLAETLDDVEGQDIDHALKTFNQRRHKDALGVCELSELGFGGPRSLRPAFMAQMILTTVLNKTVGRLAPKIFGPPSLMEMSNPEVTYNTVLKNLKRETRITNGIFLAVVASAVGILIKKAVLRV